MKKEEIAHLASLARIELTDAEIKRLGGEFTEILEYVEQLKDIVADTTPLKKTGPHYNILREDINPHEGGIHTETLLDAAPEREGRYLKVKKILGEEK